MLIREAPATELTVATRILAAAGALATDGHVAAVVGEVVYLAGNGVSASSMTPYDVTAVRLGDGLELWGEPPADTARYLSTLRAARGVGAAADVLGRGLVTAASVRALVETVLGRTWDEAEADARASGALVGADPVS